MKKPNKEDLLDKLTSGTILENELEVLKSYFNSDTEFKNEMKIRTDINKGIEHLGDQEFLFMLDTIHTKIARTKKRNKILIGVIALLFLILCYSIYSKTSFKQDNSSKGHGREIL